MRGKPTGPLAPCRLKALNTADETIAKRGTTWNMNIWTPQDIQLLKELLDERVPVKLIALQLGRTEGAVRTRAQQIGVSLRELKNSER
jgi:hypothetical protein